MGKLYLSVAASAGLLLALAASADAGGGRSVQTTGTVFVPPGFSHAPSNGNWGSSTVTTSSGPNTISTPHGWQKQSDNPSWNTSLGGPIPPGLSKCPPGLPGC
jgi:hypothetical protein